MLLQFPKDFKWGVATAAYQIEGAAKEDGRGESIWDRFSHTPDKVYKNQNGDVACDHYHRYKEDVSILKKLGVKAYRLSISWPRVIPQGVGLLNTKGTDFYSKLIDELLDNGIEPFITLYHWDLPQVLQDKGGWANRDTTKYFADYAYNMFKLYGDRVKYWITHNEPWCTSFLGNAQGVHAPGIKDYETALQVSHNVLLSHGLALKAFRDMSLDGQVGITLNLTPAYAASEKPDDKKMAETVDAITNRWFLDPIFKGNYPEIAIEYFSKFAKLPIIEDGDMDLISQDIDFLGVNYYSRIVVEASDKDVLGFKSIEPKGQYTDMGWEVYPEGLYDILTDIKKTYGDKDIYITENGAAYKDVLDNNMINDDERINYLKQHFSEAAKAIQDGVNLKGYFVWSLMDNFEWAFGYSKRFGIVYVDYATQGRILKKSAHWYKDFIKANAIKE